MYMYTHVHVVHLHQIFINIYYIHVANQSMIKRRILIGSHSGGNFPIQTANMDCSTISFYKFYVPLQKNSFLIIQW